MKLNERERARPNITGVASPAQQAEMKLLLAGKWPPLKPLPVFKYETEEYRASIDFDKARGEWVCRKTSLPSNKIEELRGGLTELTMALPHGPAEAFAECAAAERQAQELDKEAGRRLQAMLEWRENFESGALYSGLRDYLSESQQHEIEESIRLTLTARQLQFNPKNISYVFDALLKAGGKLATLLEIAQRNRTAQRAGVPAKAEAAPPDAERHELVQEIHPARERRLQMRSTPACRANVELGGKNGGVILNISETGMAIATADPLTVSDSFPLIRFQLPSSEQSIEVSAQIVWLAESKKSAGVRFVDLAAEARNQISNWISSERQAPEYEPSTPAIVENLIPAIVESFPEEPIGSAIPEQDEPSLPELMAHAVPQASETATPEIQDANPPLLVEDLQEKVQHHVPVGGYAPQVRARKLKPPVDRIENSNSLKYALEISGLQVVAFASAFLLAVIGLTVALTVGRGPLGTRLRGTQKTILADDANSPTLPNRPGEVSSQVSTPAASKAEESRSENSSAPSPKARPEDSANHVRSAGTSSAVTGQPLHDSDHSSGANSPKAAGPISGAPRNPAPRKVEPSTSVPAHRSPSSTILVTAPARGSKPFRVTFPEKPIAASSSFAMTSELSVLVPPQPGPAAAHRPSRLQAGELVSYVWPHYPKAGDRYGSAEIIKVRATIGQLGQVRDIKLLSGSNSLLSATMSAIRQWRYRPTLLNKRPVQVQQDITIEFRPPQYLSQARAQHPTHN